MTGVIAVLAGSGGKLVELEDAILGDNAIGGADARYRLSSGGSVDHYTTLTGYVAQYDWLIMGSAGDYDARATLNSGSVAGGTTGSWLDLGSGAEWQVTDLIPDGLPQSADLTIEIRHSGSGSILASANVQISADRTA